MNDRDSIVEKNNSSYPSGESLIETVKFQVVNIFSHKFLWIVIFGMLFVLGVNLHYDFINGPSYWKWPWIKLGGISVYLILFIAFIPFLFAQRIRSKNIILGILFLMLSNFSFQMLGIIVHSQDFYFDRISGIVMSSGATSYYTAAAAFTNLKEFLNAYPELLHNFPLHASNKPPGLTLYYVIIKNLHSNTVANALIGGLFVGMLATLIIPCIYKLAGNLLIYRNSHHLKETQWAAASYITLIPGLVLFMPEFDQLFPILTCLMLYTWIKALQGDGYHYGLLFGALLSFVLFVSWNVLTIGVFIVLYSGFIIILSEYEKVRLFIIQSLLAFFVVLIAYSTLWWFTGYNIVSVFETSLEIQRMHSEGLHRPWSSTIFWDIYDFLLGSGWISGFLILMLILRHIKTRSMSYNSWISIFAIGQLFVVAIGYILPGETARVWLFLQPFIIIPAAFEISTLENYQKYWLYFIVWLITASICQNMTFIAF